MQDSLLPGIKKVFQEHAHPENAGHMTRYMKNLFVYYGIKTPERRRLTKEFLKGKPALTLQELEVLIKASYQEKERELHHFAIELAQSMVQDLPESAIGIVEYMIINNSWWDSVDLIATKIVGKMIKRYPEMIKVMDQWIHASNIWLQRTAILFQLHYKKETDTQRLFSYCKQCAGSKEFFIQKAIGWALREYSKTDQDVVIHFVEHTPLAPLSRREGLKWLKDRGLLSV